jgi:hypothetical protein
MRMYLEHAVIELPLLSSSFRRRLGTNCFASVRMAPGNENCGQENKLPFAVNYTAHVADRQRFLLQGRCFQKQALAQIAKSGGLGFIQNGEPARKRESANA